MKKAILMISFGTSHLNQKKESIDPCINAVQETFKGWDIYETFASSFLRKKLKDEQEMVLLSPEDLLEKLKVLGYQYVIIQPLFLIEGIEYGKLIALANKYKKTFYIQVGQTLLSNKEDYQVLVQELIEEYGHRDTQLLILGHGSTHEAHASYKLLQQVIHEAGLKAVVTTLEDRDKIAILPLKKGKVTLIPFMLVAGNHILKDVLGEEEMSWKSGLTKLGYDLEVVTRGLGSYKSTSEIYIEHIRKAMEALQIKRNFIRLKTASNII